MRGLAAAHAELVRLGTKVFGIASQSAASHARFAAEEGLPFPLLVDSRGVTRRRLGVRRAWLGLLPGRVTYVLDRAGRVRAVARAWGDVEAHLRLVRETVRTLAAEAAPTGDAPCG